MHKHLAIFFIVISLFSSFSPTFGEEIKLLPHQQEVLDYLNRHPEQHGLVLYHALGAGKTVTSLSYAKQQSLKTVVLVPEALKAHWLKEIKKIGLPAGKVELLAFTNRTDLEKIKSYDFSNCLVIVDEVQKFIELVRIAPDSTYMNIYWQLNKVGKILLLTGTPVYNDAADIAFIGNLAAGKELFPFHPDEFKAKYMLINTGTSLFRGYLTESKLMVSTLPLYFSFMGFSLVVVSGTVFVLPILTMAGSSGLNYINELYPINKVSFREFDAAKFGPYSHQYVSFYEAANNEKTDYPKAIVRNKKVHYTKAQTEFFLDFIDGVLGREDLNMLLKDYPEYHYSDAMFYLNSAKIQQDILARGDAGREIGNLSLHGEKGLEVSAKFIEVEKIISKNPGKTAVYSSYFHNGILLFADYLREKGHTFEILRPDAGVEEITRILDNFNNGTNKILLIHPEITEGISLVGVEQMHLLEPVKNIALEKQIIGRSVRYKSHQHLPVERRKVDVYLWESEVIYSNFLLPTDAGLVRRKQWRKRFREVNPNLWTNGITQLDRQYFKKDDTPDHRVSHFKDQIAGDLESYRQVSMAHSLEKEASSENSVLVSSQLSSQFAVPMLYLNYSKYRPYKLLSFKSGEEAFKMEERESVDFSIEIPHNNRLSVGFAMRAATGQLKSDLAGRPFEIGTFDMDLGLMSRLHYEFPALPELSCYWRNELDTGVDFYLPTIGLNFGLRESVGVQTFISSHLGIAVEVGVEGKVLKDTVLSQMENKDINEAKEHLEILKRMDTMRSAQPFVSVGLFSTYF